MTFGEPLVFSRPSRRKLRAGPRQQIQRGPFDFERERIIAVTTLNAPSVLLAKIAAPPEWPTYPILC